MLKQIFIKKKSKKKIKKKIKNLKNKKKFNFFFKKQKFNNKNSIFVKDIYHPIKLYCNVLRIDNVLPPRGSIRHVQTNIYKKNKIFFFQGYLPSYKVVLQCNVLGIDNVLPAQ